MHSCTSLAKICSHALVRRYYASAANAAQTRGEELERRLDEARWMEEWTAEKEVERKSHFRWCDGEAVTCVASSFFLSPFLCPRAGARRGPPGPLGGGSGLL